MEDLLWLESALLAGVILNYTKIGLMKMNKFENILIVAGGTGGHVFPAYSLANFFKTEKKKVHLVTDERGYRYLKIII